MLRPGDLINERYQVLDQLAFGGMGTLWRARHLELEVEVALKVSSVEVASSDSIQRFKREAQAAARLRSPNIVQVLDYGVFEGQPFLVMELLQGEDLAAHLERRGKLELEECETIVHGIAKAVQLAHEAQIVHRDLKPANIFLERVGQEQVVKVLDFGIAKDLRNAAKPGSTTGAGLVGSPPYMSPEQVWGEEVGARSDVWAMGVITFEMLAGHNPFADSSLAKIFERIIREPLPKVRAFSSGLPAALEDFFARALARAPDDRIGSAAEFAREFRSALGRSEPPLAPRVELQSSGAVPSVTPSWRRHPWRRFQQLRVPARVALGLIAVSLMAAGLAWLAQQTGQVPSDVPGAPRPSDVPGAARPSEGAASAGPGELAHATQSAPESPTPSARRLAPSATRATRTTKAPRSALSSPQPTAAPGNSSSSVKPTTVDPEFGIPWTP